MPIKKLTFQNMLFLSAAFELAAAAREEEEGPTSQSRPERKKGLVIGAITSSVAFLECTVNGLYEHAKDAGKPTQFHRTLASVWSDGFERQPILAKYQLALALARKQIFKTDKEPYQSVDALISLRNAVSHPKEIISSNTQQRKLERRLLGRFQTAPAGDVETEFFPDRCLTSACAKWAVRAAQEFVKDFLRLLPPTAYQFPPFRIWLTPRPQLLR